jgi:hypothetical protein
VPVSKDIHDLRAFLYPLCFEGLVGLYLYPEVRRRGKHANRGSVCLFDTKRERNEALATLRERFWGSVKLYVTAGRSDQDVSCWRFNQMTPEFNIRHHSLEIEEVERDWVITRDRRRELGFTDVLQTTPRDNAPDDIPHRLSKSSSSALQDFSRSGLRQDKSAILSTWKDPTVVSFPLRSLLYLPYYAKDSFPQDPHPRSSSKRLACSQGETDGISGFLAT